MSVAPQQLDRIADRLRRLDEDRRALTAERDEAILKLIRAGYSQAQIAKMADISAMRVSVIARRSTATPTRSPGGSAKPRGTTSHGVSHDRQGKS